MKLFYINVGTNLLTKILQNELEVVFSNSNLGIWASWKKSIGRDHINSEQFKINK
jgi:hypothetical protein